MNRLLVLAASLLVLCSAQAQDALSAGELAAKLAAVVNDGASTARLKMDIFPSGEGKKTVLQLKADALRTAEFSGVRYQVLWPKGADGSFVLRKPAGVAATGSVVQGGASQTIARIQDGVLGSDLAYEDLVGNYFSWPSQALVGSETIKGIPCAILESKPGSSDRSSYGSIKTWVDTRRLVPLRVEKYGTDGNLVRRIAITLVAKDDQGRTIPANFAIERPGQSSRTVIEGSNIKHDVSLRSADFSPEALAAPPAAP